MTHTQAKDILDQRRIGANMPESVVIRALELTGDIDPGYTALDALRELRAEAQEVTCE